MRRVIWTLLALAMLGSPIAAADVVQRSIDLNGTSRSYYLYVPERVKGRPVPLLMLLHASYQDGERITRLWKDKADQEGFVVVAPNAIKNDGWRMEKDGPPFIQAVLMAVVDQVPIDGRRIYLFGQSGGAVFALDLSMLESEFFAATAIHGGAWRAPGDSVLLPFGKRKMPLAIIIGTEDEFFPLTAVHKTEKALKDAGFPIEVTVIPGHHHYLTPETAPDIIERSWTFLSRCKLEQPPKFAPYRMD